MLVSQLCPTLWDPTHCILPDSSVHGILHARILEWVTIPSPGDLFDPEIKPRSPAWQADSLPSEPPGKTKTINRSFENDYIHNMKSAMYIYWTVNLYTYYQSPLGRPMVMEMSLWLDQGIVEITLLLYEFWNYEITVETWVISLDSFLGRLLLNVNG